MAQGRRPVLCGIHWPQAVNEASTLPAPLSTCAQSTKLGCGEGGCGACAVLISSTDPATGRCPPDMATVQAVHGRGRQWSKLHCTGAWRSRGQGSATSSTQPPRLALSLPFRTSILTPVLPTRCCPPPCTPPCPGVSTWHSINSCLSPVYLAHGEDILTAEALPPVEEGRPSVTGGE